MADPLAESGVTMHSDSEHYSTGEESTNSPVILYKPPTVWSLVRGAAINLQVRVGRHKGRNIPEEEEALCSLLS